MLLAERSRHPTGGVGANTALQDAATLSGELHAAVPASVSDHLTPYLPSNAGGDIWGGANPQNALAPWTGFALLCGYAAALIAASAWRLRRSDA